jgi:hypothetical protein
MSDISVLLDELLSEMTAAITTLVIANNATMVQV